MSCNNCQLKNEMWHKVDTWKLDGVENHFRHEVDHLKSELSHMRYELQQAAELRQRKDEELAAIVDDINNLREQLLPTLTPATPEQKEK